MIPPSRKKLTFWAPLCLLLVCSSAAVAESGQEDTTRAAARAAGYEGLQAYEKGDMVVAVDKLGRAFAVVKVPTLGLWYARSLAKTGKLVEAAERYGEVVRLEVTEGKVKEQKQAQADADDELEALQPKIPTLTLMLVGASEDCEIILDGKTVSTKLAGLAAPVNPGTHRIVAKQSGEAVEETLSIAEGEKKSLELSFKRKPSDGTATQAQQSLSSSQVASSEEVKSASSSDSNGSAQRTVGWISLGVGGVVTVAGAVTGILALSKQGQLEDSGNCKDTVCLTTEHERVNSLNQMRTLSTVGFVVGVVGLGAGTALLLTAPKSKEAGMSAWVGVGSVGVRGSF